MLYIQALPLRQKIGAVLKSLRDAVVEWFNDPWVGSQHELAQQQRFDALAAKDREIRALKELLERESARIEELLGQVHSLSLRLDEADAHLEGKDRMIENLQADIASLQAARNEMLGGHKRKRP